MEIEDPGQACHMAVVSGIRRVLIEPLSRRIQRETAYERCKGKASHFANREVGEIILWKKKHLRGPLGKAG